MDTPLLRDLLDRIGGLLRAEQRTAGQNERLQPVHQDVLHYLSRCNRYSNTPAAVTEFLQITKGTASQSIQVLERRGLILKRADKHDRRVVRLRLSAKGQRVASGLREFPGSDDIWTAIDSAELSVTEKTMTSVLRQLQKKNGYGSFGQCYTCQHFRKSESSRFQCGLTGETLQPAETQQICREHLLPGVDRV